MCGLWWCAVAFSGMSVSVYVNAFDLVKMAMRQI